MPEIRVTGADQLRKVALDLRAAGAPARGLRSKLRRNILAAADPIKKKVQDNAHNIPAAGDRHTGLRDALAAATRVSVITSGRNVGARLIVDGKKMPAAQQGLPGLVEGKRPWRKPLFGDTEHWYPQSAHPIVAPAIPPFLADAQAAIGEALDETAVQLAKGDF